jgi:hypothetical protein
VRPPWGEPDVVEELLLFGSLDRLLDVGDPLRGHVIIPQHAEGRE